MVSFSRQLVHVAQHYVVVIFTFGMTLVRPALHWSQNMRKWSRNAENKNCIAGYFASLFSHFAPGSAFAWKLKGFRGLFFRGINKPATNYSSLFANNDEIIFLRKNLNFAKRGENTYTLFVIDSSFRKSEYFVQSNEKSPLSFIQKSLHRAKTAQNAEWKTCSRNVGENVLHTIRVS